MFLHTTNPTNAPMSANNTPSRPTPSTRTLSPVSPFQQVRMYDHDHQFSMMHMNRYPMVNASRNVNNYDFQSNAGSTTASNINGTNKGDNSGCNLHTYGARHDEIFQSQLMKLNSDVDRSGTGNKPIKREMLEMIQGHYKTMELIQQLLNSQN